MKTKLQVAIAAALAAGSALASACAEVAVICAKETAPDSGTKGKAAAKSHYANAAKHFREEFTAFEKDANATTVRIYTMDALAIVCESNATAADIPATNKERREKASKSRARMGIAQRGKSGGKKEKGAKGAKGAKPGKVSKDWQAGFSAAIMTQAGRATILSLAKAAGYVLTFAMAEKDTAPKASAKASAKSTAPAQQEIRA